MDLSQVPRICCAITPNFDLCLECFSGTHAQLMSTKAGAAKNSAAAADGSARKKEFSEGYRVADSTRYCIFPSVKSVIVKNPPSQGMDGPDAENSAVARNEQRETESGGENDRKVKRQKIDLNFGSTGATLQDNHNDEAKAQAIDCGDVTAPDTDQKNLTQSEDLDDKNPCITECKQGTEKKVVDVKSEKSEQMASEKEADTCTFPMNEDALVNTVGSKIEKEMAPVDISKQETEGEEKDHLDIRADEDSVESKKEGCSSIEVKDITMHEHHETKKTERKQEPLKAHLKNHENIMMSEKGGESEQGACSESNAERKKNDISITENEEDSNDPAREEEGVSHVRNERKEGKAQFTMEIETSTVVNNVKEDLSQVDITRRSVKFLPDSSAKNFDGNDVVMKEVNSLGDDRNKAHSDEVENRETSRIDDDIANEELSHDENLKKPLVVRDSTDDRNELQRKDNNNNSDGEEQKENFEKFSNTEKPGSDNNESKKGLTTLMKEAKEEDHFKHSEKVNIESRDKENRPISSESEKVGSQGVAQPNMEVDEVRVSSQTGNNTLPISDENLENRKISSSSIADIQSGVNEESIQVPSVENNIVEYGMKNDDTKNMWTAEEDLRLIDAIETLGLGNWADIAEEVAGSSGSSQNKTPKKCMERYFDDFLGRYGHILPQYTVIVEEEEDEKERTEGSCKEQRSETTSTLDEKYRPNLGRKRMRSETKRTSTFKMINKKRYKVVPTSSIPGYEKIWEDPFLPSMPDKVVKEGDEVGRDLSVKSELLFLKEIDKNKQDRDKIEEDYKKNKLNKPGGPTVLPPHPEDAKNLQGSEVAGYMPRRGDFDVEWDNEAENILADMEFSHHDTPEDRELKMKVIGIYNSKLDEREKRKRFLIERNLLNFRQKQLEDAIRPADERDLVNRMRLFARFHGAQEHEKFIENMLKAKRLRKEIAKLQMYRRMGFTSLVDAERFELDRDRRELHRIACREKELEEGKKRADEIAASKISTSMNKISGTGHESYLKQYKASGLVQTSALIW